MNRFAREAFFVVLWLCLLPTNHLRSQFSDQDFFQEMLNNALPRMGSSNGTFPSSGVPTSSTIGSISPQLVPGGNWNGTNPPRDWSLGVALDNTATGAIVRQVQPNSPAQRARIEPGDVIVAIGGVQVGYIDSRLNDVGDQLRRSADSSGRVRALVLDSRTSRLENITVELQQTSIGVSGLAFTRDRANLPFGSILTVRLENASRPYFEVSGGSLTLQVSGAGPFAFEFQYDPRYIDSRDQYRLTAFISDSRGQLLYSLRQPFSVSPANAITNVRLELESLRDLQIGNSGSVITAAYPYDPNALNQIYMQLLGRLPSAKEQVAWSQYLQQGNSIDDLKAKLLASPNFYDRVGNNPQLFIQTMIERLKNAPATQQEVAAWLARLQQVQGQREVVVREFLQQMR